MKRQLHFEQARSCAQAEQYEEVVSKLEPLLEIADQGWYSNLIQAFDGHQGQLTALDWELLGLLQVAYGKVDKHLDRLHCIAVVFPHVKAPQLPALLRGAQRSKHLHD